MGRGGRAGVRRRKLGEGLGLGLRGGVYWYICRLVREVPRRGGFYLSLVSIFWELVFHWLVVFSYVLRAGSLVYPNRFFIP